MKEYICIDEGVSVNVSETEDVCPNCGGEIIDVDAIRTKDWKSILNNQIYEIEDYSEMKDIDDYLNLIKEIKKFAKRDGGED